MRRAGVKPTQCIARGIVPLENADPPAAFSVIFLTGGEPVEAQNVSCRGTAPADIRCPSSIRDFRQRSNGDAQMTLTVAHISPIISVIAGLLILIMPRLLNLIVAIFLIVNGLIGLGLLKWLHM